MVVYLRMTTRHVVLRATAARRRLLPLLPRALSSASTATISTASASPSASVAATTSTAWPPTAAATASTASDASLPPTTPRPLPPLPPSPPTATTTPPGPIALYDRLVREGQLKADQQQRAAVAQLQAFHEEMHMASASASSLAQSRSLWSVLFWQMDAQDASSSSSNSATALASMGRGIYLYGGVGTGKTRMMDLLYEAQPPTMRKKRTHFHSFMLDVHARLHEMRQKDGVHHDALPALAAEIAREAQLLCFDEFQVTDVADAMILKRLFSCLFENGVNVVFTSNREPEQLYKNGLNRSLFLPFIDFLRERCVVFQLDSGVDYRKTGHLSLNTVYYAPDAAQLLAANNGHEAKYLLAEAVKNASIGLEQAFEQTTMSASKNNVMINTIPGKRLRVPRSTDQVAWFEFADLCEAPLGAAEYIAITRRYHTLFIHNVPRLSISANRNAMRRFITLIDIAYESHTKMYISAAAPPALLYTPETMGKNSGVFAGEEEHFAFDRTVSRLTEMQSESYLQRHEASSATVMSPVQ